MKLLILIIFVFSLFFSYLIYANENFIFAGKIKCELSATFIIFDFDNKIAIRNNYDSSKFKLSNYETKSNNFKNTRLIDLYHLDFFGYFLYFVNQIFFKDEIYPSKLKIFLWDKIFTPVTIIFDFLLRYRFGKNIICVYKKE